MVYIVDETQSFTITLTALLEGFGNLTYIGVTNITQARTAEWFNGAWQTPLPEAVEGDSINTYIEVVNDGAATDTLWGGFYADAVSPNEPNAQEMPNVLFGDYGSALWTFTMPAQNVNIRIDAGHVE